MEGLVSLFSLSCYQFHGVAKIIYGFSIVAIMKKLPQVIENRKVMFAMIEKNFTDEKEFSVMGRQISKYDILNFASRVTCFEEMVKGNQENRLKPVSVSHYRINDRKAEKVQDYFAGRKKKTRVIEVVSIDEIYDRIKHVYDPQNVLIARRIQPASRLLLTGKGMRKLLL